MIENADMILCFVKYILRSEDYKIAIIRSSLLASLIRTDGQ